MNMGRHTLRFSRYGQPLRATWVRLLLLSLLAQLLLPVQAHTRWHVDDRGRLVELCTLQGVQSVLIDPDSGLPQPVQPDPGFSPAMAFSALLAHAVVAGCAALPSQHVRCELPAAQRAVATPLPPDLSDAPIRGPPAGLA